MRLIVSAFLLLACSATVAFTPVAGLYWNPDESGRGFALDYQNGILVLTVYIYDENGLPIWYLAAGPMVAGNRVLIATVNEFTGGQCITCPYVPPEVAGNEGELTITFSESDNATLEWQGQTIPLVRQNFGFAPPPMGMLGEWLFVFDLDTPFAERYRFTQIGAPSGEEGGTGTFEDPVASAIGECFESGVMSGLCMVTEFDEQADPVASFLFEQRLDRVEGVYIFPPTQEAFLMQGWQTRDILSISMGNQQARSIAPPRAAGQISERVLDAMRTLAPTPRQ